MQKKTFVSYSRSRHEKSYPIHNRYNTAEDVFEDNDYFMEAAEDSSGVLAERALWRAVITQALMDAGSCSNKKGAASLRGRAIAWLAGTSKDFYSVCSLAELDPDYVRKKAKQAIRNGCKWRRNRFGRPCR